MSSPINDYSIATPRDIQLRLDTLAAQSSYTKDENAEITNAVTALTNRTNVNQATNLETTTQSLTNINIEIIQGKKDLQNAKDRVNSLRNINKHSYYESWFPINRPLRNPSKLVLIGLGIFFFILTL